jgi:biopolymer transport protein TolR
VGMQIKNQRRTLSEINVTPLVDVMLVLLIVFMVTTPIMVEDLVKKELEMNLPQTRAPAPMSPSDTIITARRNLTVGVTLGKGETELANCAADKVNQYVNCLRTLEESVKNNKPLQDASRLLVFAEQGLSYDFAVKVFASIKRAGKKKIFLITNPEQAVGK